MIEYLIMILAHIEKVSQYVIEQVLPNMTIIQLPAFVDTYLNYVAKVIAIYITIFWGMN